MRDSKGRSQVGLKDQCNGEDGHCSASGGLLDASFVILDDYGEASGTFYLTASGKQYLKS